MELTGKRVLVVGMARSGFAAAELLLARGATPVLNDLKPADAFGEPLRALAAKGCALAMGRKAEDVLDGADAVVISPGVPVQSPVVAAARAAGIPLIGEMELASRFAPCPIVAVTGTNGKTTTVTLLGRIFTNAGKIAYVAGNVGYPLSAAVLECRPEDVLVAEVSSFQMETAETFRPQVAALLNITEDHLNRHGTMAEYIRLKARVFENQTPHDVTVLNWDDRTVRALAGGLRGRVVWFSRKERVEQGAFVENGKILCAIDGAARPVMDADAILIPGPHNLENALAATACAAAMNVPLPVIRYTLQNFKGVEHRIERVAEVDGVTYINDSKGTNTDSTEKAVLSMKTPTVLLLGGYDKHCSFDALAKLIAETPQIAHVVVLGQTARKIADALAGAGYAAVTHADSLEDAVEKARNLAPKGGAVLLSPACASFDMFSDYEQRGRVFKEIVERMRG